MPSTKIQMKINDIIYLKGTKSVGNDWNEEYKHQIGMECKIWNIFDYGHLSLKNMQGEFIGWFKPEDVSLEPIEEVKKTNEQEIEKKISSILHGNYGTSHKNKLHKIMIIIKEIIKNNRVSIGGQ